MAGDADVRRRQAGQEVASAQRSAAAPRAAPASIPRDTIAAVATASGRAGIGVVRITGPRSVDVARAVTGRNLKARQASFCDFRDREGGLIDQGIALWFPGPNSYTGEDTLELQGHGGDAVLKRLLERCLEQGCRLAEPGEFTKRAFLNEKIDLAQAEAVADLIEASTAAAAKSAARSLSGEFSAKVRELSEVVISLRMFVEASLDFPEEDLEFIRSHDIEGKLGRVNEALKLVLAQAKHGALLRSGLRVVILGQPNVGKSSLLNRLAGQDVAIVTPVPGTTRDTLREHIEIDGVALHIVDTAGLRATDDEVERLGIARTWRAAGEADVALLVVDATRGPSGADQENQEILAQLPTGLPVIRVNNKIDLTTAEAGTTCAPNGGVAVNMSAKSGAGLRALQEAILAAGGWQARDEDTLMARQRHVDALMRAHTHLETATGRYDELELLAEELRLAQQQLSSITGEFTADDLLGEIFSKFCVGK